MKQTEKSVNLKTNVSKFEDFIWIYSWICTMKSISTHTQLFWCRIKSAIKHMNEEKNLFDFARSSSLCWKADHMQFKGAADNLVFAELY